MVVRTGLVVKTGLVCEGLVGGLCLGEVETGKRVIRRNEEATSTSVLGFSNTNVFPFGEASWKEACFTILLSKEGNVELSV